MSKILLCYKRYIEAKHFSKCKTFEIISIKDLKNGLTLHGEHYEKNVLLSRIYLVFLSLFL